MLDQQAASTGIRLRLAAFILAIAGMVGIIAWTAQSAWRHGGELREKLTLVQLQSFQIADHFQEKILELNNSVLRYGAYHDRDAWARFQTNSIELDHWIDDQRSVLSTDRERRVLDLINTNYDHYIAAAREIEKRLGTNSAASLGLKDFADFEKQSQRLLKQGFVLADTHRASMDNFLQASKRSLGYLRALLATSLAMLLAAGTGLAVMVYGELIAPLRVKLVESQQLMGRQEKLASLGMLAAGVAHEIRNPLTAIKAWLFIQKKHFKPGSPEQAEAEIIGSEINRLERIAKDVLLFARPSNPEFTTVQAHQPLESVQTLLAPELKKSDIQLVVENSVNAAVRVDLQQIQQVLINLIQNAAESIGRSGTVTLRTRTSTKRLSDRVMEVVILEVSDTGKGIPPQVEKRLFDPFFSTKETGTGLGLSIAARIVEKHGGALQYQTQINRGTTFGIVLPKADAKND
ncbi:MAG TPA: ATP-binding protein [Verrucomicrobiae bacterium]|nr:ATP-binding protein [Verrucomicrobiae bacterium]